MPFSLPPVIHLDETGLFHQGSEVAKLQVKSFETEIDRGNGTIIYRGGVKATYGVSVLSADVLIVRQGNEGDAPVEINEGGKAITLLPFEAMAIGKVDVVDPDGTLQASNLWFTWDKIRRAQPETVTGRAEMVDVRVGSSHIRASKVAVSDTGLDFSKLSFWTSNWRTPLFKFDASSLFIYPGKKGVAKNVQLSLLGVPLPIIPQYTFTLDPRSHGLILPTLGYRQDAGVGISWNTNIPVNKASTVSASLTAFPNTQPTYTVSYVRSNVPDKETGINQFEVTSPFGERSPFSFFESIYTPSLDVANSRMRTRKNLFSVSSRFNYETLGRVTDRITNYSEPLEVGYENGGPVGNWSYLFQTKGSEIIEAGNKSAVRLSLNGSAFAPLLKNGRFTAGTRFDASANLDASSSGFFGVETGFSYEPANKLTFSAGAYGYKTVGKPLFDGDTFRTNQGFVVRGDWFGGATNLSLMFRYDPTQGWFDREYRISQVVGPIEPVLVYRVSPRQYVFGLKFRTQDIARMLQGRKVKRNTELPENKN